MNVLTTTLSEEGDLQAVRSLIRETLYASSMKSLIGRCAAEVCGGKMLRARLILAVGPAAGMAAEHRFLAAASVEMIHSASLLHDDVVDGGLERRGLPAFWVSEGTKLAVLLGDMLVSAAFGQIQGILPDAIPLLVQTLQEMCNAEIDQEFLIDRQQGDWETCVSIARRKTGSLFGFTARCAAGADDKLAAALLRAGYALGTAYQLADDLLDEREDVANAGKTLGSDRRDNKLTATVFQFPGQPDPDAHIKTLLLDAESELDAWPTVKTAWKRYAADTIMPVILSFTRFDPMEEAAV